MLHFGSDLITCYFCTCVCVFSSLVVDYCSAYTEASSSLVPKHTHTSYPPHQATYLANFLRMREYHARLGVLNDKLNGIFPQRIVEWHENCRSKHTALDDALVFWRVS